MKINEVVTEAWGMGTDPLTGKATGVLGRLASDLVGDENYAATAKWNRDRRAKANAKRFAADIPKYRSDLASTIKDTLPDTADQMVSGEPENKFLSQFEIIDQNPITVQYKNETYQRDEHGKWINFKSGQEVPTRVSTTLDKVSPPAKGPSPAEQMPLMSPPKEPAKPAVWRSNRAPNAAATTAPAAPAAPEAKAKLARMPDGGTVITDKQNKKWTKPAGKQYWTNEQGAIFMPGSPEYTKLDSFSSNLKENSRYNKQ